MEKESKNRKEPPYETVEEALDNAIVLGEVKLSEAQALDNCSFLTIGEHVFVKRQKCLELMKEFNDSQMEKLKSIFYNDKEETAWEKLNEMEKVFREA